MPPPAVHILPDAAKLAALVSHVTQTMCGFSFAPARPQGLDPALCWRIALLSIKGVPPLHVALSSDRAGCTALGAALFSCRPDALDAGMIDDALRELLNMAAGQIKMALAIDRALGLPKILGASELPAKTEQAMRQGLVLRSQGDVGLLIWISEGD